MPQERSGSHVITGGCLCGGVRYRASAPPIYAGYCCCGDCRRATGSGFAPFMGFRAADLLVEGETRRFESLSYRGGPAVRNACPTCAGLVFGGIYGKDDMHTVYAGSLDRPDAFQPQIVIFNRDRPDWVVLPPGLAVFDTMPD